MIKNNFTPVLFIVLFTLLLLNFSGCCRSEVQSQNTKSGVVKMTGHEPFAKLTLIVSDTEAYALECTGAVKDELMANQGESYTVQYSEIKEVMKQKVLVVSKVMKTEN